MDNCSQPTAVTVWEYFRLTREEWKALNEDEKDVRRLRFAKGHEQEYLPDPLRDPTPQPITRMMEFDVPPYDHRISLYAGQEMCGKILIPWKRKKP